MGYASPFPNEPHAVEIVRGLFCLSGAVNTGVLVSGERAILFDCCDSITLERLASHGVVAIDQILCTQFRRPNIAGAYALAAAGAKIIGPEAERPYFEEAESYWRDWKNRWHVYHNRPGPLAPLRSLPLERGVREGDTIEWESYTIRVIETPGMTDGSVSYLVDLDDNVVCFCGDVIYAPGQVWDLHSLQKGYPGCLDYHGFLGARPMLEASIEKIAGAHPEILVPSHGAPILEPGPALELLEERLGALYRNFASISAVNHYFPSKFEDIADDPARMKPAQTFDPPDWVRRVAFTSFAVVSDDGAALLVDCGHDSVVSTLQEWQQTKQITSVDGCWVTHYHDDHVDCLQRAVKAFDCPIMTEQHMTEVLEYPRRFFLPCLAPCAGPVAKSARHGESWQWHEFTLTAYHFPGQTYYHAGLMVEGHGKKVFFAGDSGAPTGLDDYCAGNRNFLGVRNGSRQCLELWREIRPDLIFNQHQGRAFAYTDEELDYQLRQLEARERLVAEMTPWPHADFAVDEWWARTYPYEQDASRGGLLAIDLEFTNHAGTPAQAIVEPVLPEGWTWDAARSSAHVTVPGATDGSRGAFCSNPDAAARMWIAASASSAVGQYTISFRVNWDGRYLGQYRHAIVHLW